MNKKEKNIYICDNVKAFAFALKEIKLTQSFQTLVYFRKNSGKKIHLKCAKNASIMWDPHSFTCTNPITESGTEARFENCKANENHKKLHKGVESTYLSLVFAVF